MADAKVTNGRVLGRIFYGSFYDAGTDERVRWLIQCRYCKDRVFGRSLHEAAQKFEEHMYSGDEHGGDIAGHSAYAERLSL